MHDLLHAPLAIVIPFTSWESETLLQNFELWNTYTPCHHVKVDLVFYFHKDLTRQSGHLVRMFRDSIQKNGNVSRCFNSINFLNSGLTDSEDIYPESASRMFFRLFKSHKMASYQSFYYMEADVMPCRSGWLDSLVKESQITGGFWVRGSIIRGSDAITGQYPYSNHINGNALYAIGDSSFRSFINDIIEPKFWEDPNLYLGGYDVALYLIRLDRTIISWDLFTQVYKFHLIFRETIHLFQYTTTIQNYYRTPTNATMVCKTFPNTYLVHGRKVFY